MNFQIDYHDVVSILADVRRRGRLLEPVFRDDLPALLGHRLPSGLGRVADAARDGNLVRGYGRDMLPVVIAACDRAIADGVSTRLDCYETAYVDGAVEMACREIEVMTEAALSLLPIRRDLREIVDLLERVDDLITAQRAICGCEAEKPDRCGRRPTSSLLWRVASSISAGPRPRGTAPRRWARGPKEPARDFPANQLLRAFRTGTSGCSSPPDRKDPKRSWRQEPGD